MERTAHSPTISKIVRLLKWVVYLVAGLAVLSAGLLLSGYVYEKRASAADYKQHPAPGQLVDVGGFKLHLYCMGEGSPTVLVDAGWGDFVLGWSLVQPEVATFTRICTYDRAGYGWSEPSPNERTVTNIAQELNALVEAAAIAEPYVLVGHSFGGLNVRMYEELYPNKVSAMVLVDSGHEELRTRIPFFEQVFELQAQQLAAQVFMARFGLSRFYYEKVAPDSPPPPGIDKLPGDIQPLYLSILGNTKTTLARQQESGSTYELSEQQMRQIGDLGNLPLKVLVAEKDYVQEVAGYYDLPEAQKKSGTEAWFQLQQELASLSDNSELMIAEGSGHGITVDRPDLVIDAIRQAVADSLAAN